MCKTNKIEKGTVENQSEGSQRKITWTIQPKPSDEDILEELEVDLEPLYSSVGGTIITISEEEEQ